MHSLVKPTNSLSFNCSYSILKKSHRDGYQCLEAAKSSPLMFTIQPCSKRHCEGRVEESDSGREIWFLLSACENRGSSPQAWEIQSSHIWASGGWLFPDQSKALLSPLVRERLWPAQTGVRVKMSFVHKLSTVDFDGRWLKTWNDVTAPSWNGVWQ